MIETMTIEHRMKTALEQVLLFHSATQWTEEKRKRWADNCALLLPEPSPDKDPRLLYGTQYGYDATSKMLCDCVRAAMLTPEEKQ